MLQEKELNLKVDELWDEVLKCVSEKLGFGQFSMDLWFGGSELKKITLSHAYIKFPEDSTLYVVESKYMDVLKASFKEVLGFDVEPIMISVQKRPFEEQLSDILCSETNAPKENIEYTVREDGFKVINKSDMVKKTTTYAEIFTEKELQSGLVITSKSTKGFSPNYTFENFVTGSSNRLAHAACMAFASDPDSEYNPMFIHGNPGLGKTHLLYAVIREISLCRPNSKIVYVKCEDFTNELIEAIRCNTTYEFREKYRTADVLLIDDIQFIGGKHSTEEEFFHTFNTLFEANKQIIMTSDRPPKDISTLADRIRSRFESSAIIEILPPDLELRIAIFKTKAQNMGIMIPNDVLLFLAENISDNIRQIEGIIKKIKATSFIKNDPITMDTAQNIIKDFINGPEIVLITKEKILKKISQKFGITEEDILGKKRNGELVNARHIAIYLTRNLTDLSLLSIGKYYNRDHTTIMTSIDNVKEKIESSKEFSDLINTLMEEMREV